MPLDPLITDGIAYTFPGCGASGIPIVSENWEVLLGVPGTDFVALSPNLTVSPRVLKYRSGSKTLELRNTGVLPGP